MRIESSKSSQIRHVAALQKKARYRKEEKAFVVEGIKMVEEAPPEKIRAVYASDSFLERGGARSLAGSLIRRYRTPPLRLCRIRRLPREYWRWVDAMEWDPEELLGGEAPLLILLEGLQDPGNLGTILRAGEGAGVTGVIMSRDTVDIYNPKVIRSTMGSIYRVPFMVSEDLRGTLAQCRKRGIVSFAAHLSGTSDYDRRDYRGPSAFLIGNEAAGLSEELSAAADVRVKIPMKGSVESLNAAVAAAVFLYEAARQRRL